MAEQNENPTADKDPGGRPPTLDERKRRQIIAILANGSSRRVAARAVGCSTSTIQRTADRDPEFAAELDAAEQTLEIEALRHIRQAAKNGRYWRASAWLLERRNPSDFARRDPNTLTEQDVLNLWLHVSDPLIRKLSDEEFDEFQDKLHEMAMAFYESDDLAKYLPIPPPEPPEYVARPDPIGDCPNSHTSEDGTVPFGTDASLCPDDCAICSFALARANEPGATGFVCDLNLRSSRYPNRTEPPDNAAAQTADASGDCPNFRPSENGTVPVNAAQLAPAQPPAERASRGFATHDEKAVDPPGDQSSPLFIVAEPLTAIPLPATPTP